MKLPFKIIFFIILLPITGMVYAQDCFITNDKNLERSIFYNIDLLGKKTTYIFEALLYDYGKYDFSSKNEALHAGNPDGYFTTGIGFKLKENGCRYYFPVDTRVFNFKEVETNLTIGREVKIEVCIYKKEGISPIVIINKVIF